MGIRGLLVTGLALAGFLAAGHAGAQDAAASAALRGTRGAGAVGGVSGFDMRDLAGVAPGPAARVRTERLNTIDPPEDIPDKAKLRWRYSPQEGGPRFEFGSFGSRKGAMKHKLFHVAMDWTF